MQVIFASLTGDIMLDALIGAVFAIVSYSSGSGPADGDLNRRRGHFLPGGAVPGDRCQPRLWPAGDAQQQRRQRCRPPRGAGELLFKLVGSLIILPFVHPLANLMDNLSLPKAELVIYFHVFYNWCAAAMVPFAAPMARFCERLIRDEPELDARLKPKHLDTSVLDTPALAIANAARETLRMGDAMETMLEGLQR